MESSGGCCIARYAGGSYDMSKLDRIMLKFRPIAPKPAAGGSISEKSNDVSVRSVRGKRKYVRNSNKQRCNKKPKEEKKKVTLPLLPETPDRKAEPTAKKQPKVPIWLNLCKNEASINLNRQMYGVPDQRSVGSCMTVECVTDSWVDAGMSLGRTDEERRRNLVKDTCPAMISDGLNRVTWTNEAYKRMVGQREGVDEGMMVWLVMKDRVPVSYPAFTCRVRVQYTCGKEKSSLTVPCDVWRMDGGGFAWRLDIKAALSLRLSM